VECCAFELVSFEEGVLLVKGNEAQEGARETRGAAEGSGVWVLHVLRTSELLPCSVAFWETRQLSDFLRLRTHLFAWHL
jgi:hypothetical protein